MSKKSPLDKFFLDEDQSKWYLKGRKNAFKEMEIIVLPGKEIEYWKSWRIILEMKGLEILKLLKEKDLELYEKAWKIWINTKHYDKVFNIRGFSDREEYNKLIEEELTKNTEEAIKK